MGGISDGSNDWIVIGISGVTCGGKSTLAGRLLRSLTPAAVLHQDAYFLPDTSARHRPLPDLKHNNYDVLSALDMDAMYQDVMSTLSGVDRSHEQSDAPHPGRLRLEGKKFLVLEGFTVLNYKPLNDLCHLRYYFVLDYGTCMFRRVLRVYSPPDVPGYFETCVWPEHLKYRAMIEKDPRVTIVSGEDANVFDKVIADLCEMGATFIQ